MGMLENGGGADFRQEPVGARNSSQLGLENLHSHSSIVLQVRGEIDRGHSAFAELTLDSVEAFEGSVQTSGGVRHAGQDASKAC